MRSNLIKSKFILATTFMIAYSGAAYAFPLPTFDMSRMSEAARMTANQIIEIKLEIESNYRIIQEIQNGGFGAAAGDLFSKIQNGNYDRFGNNLRSLKDEADLSVERYKETQAAKAREMELRAEGMSEELAREQATKESAERQATAAMQKAEKDAQSRETRKNTALNNTYNWLKNNRSVTNAAVSATYGLQNGNVGQVVGSAVQGTGSVLGNSSNADANKVGEVMRNTGYNAGNTVNSVLSGNWGEAISSTGQGVGNTVSNSGNQNVGAIISNSSSEVGQAVEAATSGNWKDAGKSAQSGATDAAVSVLWGEWDVGKKSKDNTAAASSAEAENNVKEPE